MPMHWRILEGWARLRGALFGVEDAETSEELRFHLEMATQRNIERGMSAEAARRDALVRFGGVDRTREEARDVQRSRWLSDAAQDARHALRMLRRNPGFALAAVLTLALGIGANSAIFSVLEAVLLRPLPYHAPEQLVEYTPQSYDRYTEWTARARTLKASGAHTVSIANITGGAEPVRVWTLAVTASLLPTLGLEPAIGRGFSAEDDAPGAAPRVLLTHDFWREQFSSDPRVLGRTIALSGLAYEVIGVLPAALEFPPPTRREGAAPLRTDVWIGVGRLSDLHERGGFHVVSRLRPGVTAAQAAAELTAVANETRRAGTEAQPITVMSITERVIAPLRPAVLAFSAAVALVLLIACANLGSLLLARLAGRQKELSVRISLGSGAGRIVRQIITEGAVLAFGGALAGIGFAWLLLRWLLALAPRDLARVQDASLSGTVLAYTLGLTVLTALLIGLLPALRVLRRDPHVGLGSTRGSTVDRGTGRVHGALVALEIAFAVVLLVGGGLLLRSFSTLASVDPGFRTDGLVTADLLLPPDRYQNRAAVLQFFERLEERLSAQPGVQSVSAIDRLPYAPSWSGAQIDIVGRATPSGTELPRGSNAAARAGYFRTIGIPVLQGREFTSADATDAPKVALIGRALAQKYWPDESPLGQRIRVFGIESEIVGVVGDVRHLGPTTPVDAMVYLPHTQDVATRRMMTVVTRTQGAPEAAQEAMRREIRSLDPQLPITNLRNFDALRAERTASQRFNALLIASFATLAVLLAAVGIYGVLSFVVAQRRREIGVRMALGASRWTVLRGFLFQALRAAAIGSALGIVIALLLTRFLRTLLYGVGPTDPLTYLAVLALVATLAMIAAWIPARRAAGIQPLTALTGD
ncbi:MAG: ABC transporter permease [Gemmatimonadota bacterium]